MSETSPVYQAKFTEIPDLELEDTWYVLREKESGLYYSGSVFNGEEWEPMFTGIDYAVEFPSRELAEKANVGRWEIEVKREELE